MRERRFDQVSVHIRRIFDKTAVDIALEIFFNLKDLSWGTAGIIEIS